MLCYVILLIFMTETKKEILSVNIKLDIKEKLKKYAEGKRWSMSQSAAYLIEEGLERELGLQKSKPEKPVSQP